MPFSSVPMNHSSQKAELQFLLEALPFGQLGGKQVVKGTGVVSVGDMAQLVDNNVLNVSCRCLDELLVQYYPMGFLGIASPAPGHSLDHQSRQFIVPEPGKACVQPVSKDVCRLFPVPGIEKSLTTCQLSGPGRENRRGSVL